MNLELLQTFCQDDPERCLGKPWTKDGFTYAGDGFILLRVPAIPEDPGGRGTAVDKLYAQAGPIPEDGWLDLPAIPEPPACSKCKGDPAVNRECPECDGYGEVDLSNAYSEYTCDCKTCGGSGEIEGCSKCHGTGVEAEAEPLQVGSRRFKLAILRMVATLPKAQIAPTDNSINWVRFEGGDALVMPQTEAN